MCRCIIRFTHFALLQWELLWLFSLYLKDILYLQKQWKKVENIFIQGACGGWLVTEKLTPTVLLNEHLGATVNFITALTLHGGAAVGL